MNHPLQSRWLRMRCLLLLVPLLVAATPSPQPQLLPVDSRLGFASTPAEITPGQCIPVVVQTQPLIGTGGINLGFSVIVTLTQSQPLGTFYSVDGCQGLITEALIPAGASSTRVYYKAHEPGRVTFIASDGVLGLAQGTSQPISVVIALTDRLEFTAVPGPLRPGSTADVTVTAYNELGVALAYAGRVRLSSNLPIPGLPLDTRFDPLQDPVPGKKTFTLTFQAPGPYQLKIEDLDAASLQAQSAVIPVLLPRLSVVPRRKTPGRCEPTTFDLTVVDNAGLPEPAIVRLCRPRDSRALLVPTQQGDVASAPCAIRVMNGPQQVTWFNTQTEDTLFTLEDAQLAQGDLAISWSPQPSAQRSSLSIPGGLGLEATLSSYTQQVPVRFELRDACGDPLVPPGKTFRFKAPDPLFVSPVSQPEAGVWTATVSLGYCEGTFSQPLLVQPTFDDTVINKGPGDPYQLGILPTCSAPLVELSLRSKEERPVVAPDDLVQFEVKLENKGTQTVTHGVLLLSVDGLTLIEAKADGAPLPLQDTSAVLPPLEPTQTVTVRVTAKTPMELDTTASVTARYTTQEGVRLTPDKSVTFTIGDMGVNVGCGSQPATLPSHLVAWLVLLLAASRPWERSRRVRQRERNDRQAPW